MAPSFLDRKVRGQNVFLRRDPQRITIVKVHKLYFDKK